MIWCLPGFLGHAADWEPLAAACATAGLPPVRPIDLFDTPVTASLTQWGAAFAERVAQEADAPVLVGYSLGGRLALHALLAAPTLWRGAVVASTHPGLDDAAARAARAAEDEVWADRFERDDWETLLTDWDARPVFAERRRVGARPESAFHRPALAHALRAWSLGRQNSLVAALAGIPCPVLWIAGARDPGFLAQAERAMQYLPRGALGVAPGAAHRVPWEAPDWFHAHATAFIASLD